MNDKQIWRYGGLTVVLILLASLPFVLHSNINPLNPIDAERFSQYGSYIGGLIGASCAGLSLIIIVLTYRHQLGVEQSNSQTAEVDRLEKLYESVVDEISNLSYKGVKGSEVFFQFKMQSIHEPQGVLDQLNSLLTNFNNLLLAAKRTKFRTSEEQSTMLARIYFLYYAKILWPVHASIWTEMRAWIAENHDDASIYFTKYEELADETIEYLTRNNLVKGGKKHFRKSV